MTEERRSNLRNLIKTKYDYQSMRIATANRLAIKVDNTVQAKEAPGYRTDDILEFVDIKDETESLEKKIDKAIMRYIKDDPVYKGFLKDVKGVGPALAGVILSEIDIEKATTISKIWQYAGMNPSMVLGKKKVNGELVVTGELIRGDRPTSGYILPYNKFLKTKLLGVLADSFIKSRSPYTEYYYNMKERLANSEKDYKEGKPWKEESKMHINMAARRYMVKMFLADYYKASREILGLPVRPPYQEEYLGHVHVG